jgi:glycosyltransferase involved in cell wall biosynthesis
LPSHLPQQSWSIIIFCYDEQAGIAHVIDRSLEVLQELDPHKYELIVVNDGSSDNTSNIIRDKCREQPHIKVIEHGTNQGIGVALLDGYAKATNENICAIPGDGQFDPRELLPFATIPDNHIISFYRQQTTRYTPYRKFLSLANKMVNRYVLGIKVRDVNWIKVYKRHKLDQIKISLHSSLIESEICAKMVLKNHEIVEVQSTYHPRKGGVSKGSSFSILMKALLEVLSLMWEINRERLRHMRKSPQPVKERE